MTFSNLFLAAFFLKRNLKHPVECLNLFLKCLVKEVLRYQERGMEAIPKQLSQKLKQTTIKFNTKVATIEGKEITLVDGNKLESHYTIVATEASNLCKALNRHPMEWRSCHNLYFETEDKVVRKRLIGLISEKGALINNIAYSTSLKCFSKEKKELLSVTVIDDQNLSQEELVIRVKSELKDYCDINAGRLIKQYDIPMALPKLTKLKHKELSSETRLHNNLFLAGDTLLNGSLNAAMISGETAAYGLMEAWADSNS